MERSVTASSSPRIASTSDVRGLTPQPGRACTDDDYISFVSPRNFSPLGAEYPGSGIYVNVAVGYVFEKQLPAT